MGFLKNCKFLFPKRDSRVGTGVPILALGLSATLHLGVLLWVFGVSWPADPVAGGDGAEIVTVMLEADGRAAPGPAVVRTQASPSPNFEKMDPQVHSPPSDAEMTELRVHSPPSDIERTDPQGHLPLSDIERVHSRPDPVLSDAVQAHSQADPVLPEVRQASPRTDTVSRDDPPTRPARPVDVKPRAASADRASMVAERARTAASTSAGFADMAVVAERTQTPVASAQSRSAHDGGVTQGPSAAPVLPAGRGAQAAGGATQIASVDDAVAQDVEPPRVVAQADYLGQRPTPAYPPQSERRGEQGRVVLRVLISAQGRPVQIDVRTSSGYPRLDQAAVAAVREAHFRPYREDGIAYRALVDIPFDFVL